MSTTWEQEIRAREEENRVAFLAADLAALDRLWTDDFAVNSPLNFVNDKRRTLALLEAALTSYGDTEAARRLTENSIPCRLRVYR